MSRLRELDLDTLSIPGSRRGNRLSAWRRRQAEGEWRRTRAWTFTLVNAGCLWWWTWLQWVAAFCVTLPRFQHRPDLRLGYYVKPPGFDWDVPSMFLGLTVLGLVMLIEAAVVTLREVEHAWRHVLVLSIFGVGALGMSLMVLSWERGAFDEARTRLNAYGQAGLPPFFADYRRWDEPRLRKALEAYRISEWGWEPYEHHWDRGK